MQANGGAWQVDSSGCTEGGSVSLELQGPFGSPDPGCLLDFQGNQADGVGIVMGFTDACSIYSASGYSITTSDGITIKSVTLGHCNSYTAGSFKLRFTAPDGAVTDVAITGMPVEEIGSFSYNVPGWGFSVPPDAEGYTLQLVGAPFDAAAAYLRALSTQQCNVAGETCESDTDCCATARYCAGPTYPPQCASVSGWEWQWVV
ncbi:hypothetical protein D9Q98_009184 [Chlorella vulgaris]|uniref:Uncharacterized protein n=1 Tax=Chlorella vulgaris TaxID=3077 RepID=A0A9D4TP54_CHLVU|nr:hypothetical protein D9Q98_009184 [Chlorella vulgaris]